MNQGCTKLLKPTFGDATQLIYAFLRALWSRVELSPMQLSAGSKKRKALYLPHSEPTSSRRRCPELKQLPQWLWAPLQVMVRSRSPLSMEWDNRGRPVLDWDAWACMHLTRDYWEISVPMRETWLSCIRQWAAKRQEGDFSLVASPCALVSAIVNITVAETLAHQHNTSFAKLDLSVRRHINTTANRQRENSKTKVTLHHVVQLALARFDLDVFLNDLSFIPWRQDLQHRTQVAFDSMYATAESNATPADLRAVVVALTRALRAPMRDFLFIPWYEPLSISLSGGNIVESAARAFVKCIPVQDIAPISPYNAHRCIRLEKLSSPAHDSRWEALVNFFHLCYRRLPVQQRHELRADFAFAVMAVLLHAGLEHTLIIQENITLVAAEHTRRQSPSRRPLVFRNLLDLKLDSAARQLRYAADQCCSIIGG